MRFAMTVQVTQTNICIDINISIFIYTHVYSECRRARIHTFNANTPSLILVISIIKTAHSRQPGTAAVPRGPRSKHRAQSPLANYVNTQKQSFTRTQTNKKTNASSRALAPDPNTHHPTNRSARSCGYN